MTVIDTSLKVSVDPCLNIYGQFFQGRQTEGTRSIDKVAMLMKGQKRGISVSTLTVEAVSD